VSTFLAGLIAVLSVYGAVTVALLALSVRSMRRGGGVSS
jgi:hypothetical protein